MTTDEKKESHRFGVIGSHGFVTILFLFVGVLLDTPPAQKGSGVQGGMGSVMNSHLISQNIVTTTLLEFFVQS